MKGLGQQVYGNRQCIGDNPEYHINDREFKGLLDIFKGSEDFKRFCFRMGPDYIVYTGAEHKPACLGDKLPNETFVPNIKGDIDEAEMTLMGNTGGHYQAMPGEKRVQEVYEYHGFGAMVIDHDGRNTVDFVLLKPGDKVVVENQCHMTIYNLDGEPLETSDYANPLKKGHPMANIAHKDMQESSKGGIGPIFCIYEEGDHIIFRLNEKYVNNSAGNPFMATHGSGVLLEGYLELRGDEDNPRQKSKPRLEIRVDGSCLGKEMYDTLLHNESVRQMFRDIKVNLIEGSPTVTIGDMVLSSSLADEIKDPSRKLQRYFGLI